MPEAKEPKTLEQLAKERVEACLEADRLGAEAEQQHDAAVDFELEGKSAEARKAEARAGDLRLKASARERLAERLDDEMQARAATDLAELAAKGRENAAAMDAHREAVALRVLFHFLSLARCMREWKIQIVQAAPPAPGELCSQDPTTRNRERFALVALLRSIAEDASGRFLREIGVTGVDAESYEKVLREVFPEGCSHKALYELGNKMRELHDTERKFRLKAERTMPGDLIDFAIRSARADAGLSNAEPVEDGEADAPQTSAQAAETVAGD